MKNTTDYESLKVHPEVFSLDKFIESDAPGTLSWINTEENYPDTEIPPFKEGTIPCQHLCAGCKRWQIESSEKTSLPDRISPETK